MARTLSGPGNGVCTTGLEGSSGKKDCWELGGPGVCAVATFAADLLVVVTGRMMERQVRGRRREQHRRITAMTCVFAKRLMHESRFGQLEIGEGAQMGERESTRAKVMDFF